MKIFIAILLALTAIIALGAIEALIIMLLWNYVLCAIFTALPIISFWLAWGIAIIINILTRTVTVKCS